MRLDQYRRGFVRPLSEEAADMLRIGEIPAAGQVEHYKIDNKLYEKHFQVFNDLDRVCGIAGDDFEAEEVEVERLDRVIKMLRTYPHEGDRQLEDMLDRMWGLCHRAKVAGMPVFVVL